MPYSAPNSPSRNTSRRQYRSARVVLERPTLAQAEEFIAAVARSGGLHRRWVSAPADLAAYTALVERNDLGALVTWLVRDRASGDLAGVFNLSQIIRGPLQQAFLGYYGFHPMNGRGLMQEGMRLLLRFAFTELKLHRIEANIQPGNAASLRLAKTTGFRQEGFSPRYLKIAGRWRDHERWAINAEDWQAQRQQKPTE